MGPSLTWIEALGFLTGGACVWLMVRENMWNWPVGLVNNALFFALFYGNRLYGTMSLQAVLFALGVYGWWNWKFGGAEHTELRISRLRRVEWISLAVAVPLLTALAQRALIAVEGAAPLLDALTTAVSLCAQYMMTLKRLEHWWLWIVANVLAIALYASRELPLTAALYAVFLLLCISGLRRWMRSFTEASPQPR